MTSLGGDLRDGWRTLVRAPGYSALVVFTLALGIAGRTLAFTFVNAVLLKPLPFSSPDQLVVVRPTSGARLSSAYLHDWRESSETLDDLAGWHDVRMTLTGSGEPLEVKADRTTPNFFVLLGTPALVGRTYSAEPTLRLVPSEVVLSHGFWRQRFGGRPDIVGTPVTLDGTPVTVVGVMPEGFALRTNELPESRADVWVPFALEPGNRTGMGGSLNVVGRLAPGVTPAQAEDELAAIARRIEEAFPSYSRDWRAGVVPLHDATVRDVRLRLLVLFGAVGFLLLVACANVAQLVSSRGVGRQTELAIRLSLGATGGRIFRQLMCESLALAGMGGLVALVVAAALTAPLVTLLAPALDLPRTREIGIAPGVLAFGVVASLLSTVIVGLAPALAAARATPHAVLGSGRGSATGPGHRRLGSVVLVSEVALAVVLLSGAGLLGRSTLALTRVDPGFRAEGALTMRTTLSGAAYDEHARVRQFGRDLLERVGRLPGVTAVAIADYLPLSRFGGGGPFVIAGRPAPVAGEAPASWISVVGGRYFEAMGIPLRRGRVFQDTDTEGTAPVVVIDERLARRYWPDSDPLGAHLTWRERDGATTTREVVGVVGSVRYQGLATDPAGTAYFWSPQRPARDVHLVVRTGGDPMALAGAVRAQVRAIDDHQPVSDVQALTALLAADTRQSRSTALLVGGVAVVATTLAAVGLYAVVAFAVARRTREVGVRMALGATAADIVGLLMRRELALVGLGLALGVLAALAAGRLAGSLLFGVSAADPATLSAVVVLLAITAAIATAMPASRAARIDPAVTLRAD